MDQRAGGMPRPRPLDHGDPRTPMAWQHRNMNHQHMCPERYGGVQACEMEAEEPMMEDVYHGAVRTFHPQHHQLRNRPTSPSTNTSATSDSTGLDSDSHLKCDVILPLRELGSNRPPTLGTLRSLQSSLATWDGEPCPVHHIAVLPPPPPQLYPVMALAAPPPPPAVLLPPMLRPRPLVLAADAPAPLEPLPVRDPKTCMAPLPPKDILLERRKIRCCKGNIVVFWIILGIIFVGILLGVILRFVTT